VTLGHETQTAEYGKIDPDSNLQFDLGPGRIRYVAATMRQNFRYGSLQATFEQADARDLDSGQVTPEAPRLIGDLSWTYQKLPFHLQAKGEFEYVGRKVVGNGCNESVPNDLTSYCLGVPNKEFRLAVARPFLAGRINVGVNMMIARGYTGQTTENLATDYKLGYLGSLPVPDNPVGGCWSAHTFVRERELYLPVWSLKKKWRRESEGKCCKFRKAKREVSEEWTEGRYCALRRLVRRAS